MVDYATTDNIVMFLEFVQSVGLPEVRQSLSLRRRELIFARRSSDSRRSICTMQRIYPRSSTAFMRSVISSHDERT